MRSRDHPVESYRRQDQFFDNGRQFDDMYGRDGIRDSASSFLEEGRRRSTRPADNFGSSGGGGFFGASNDRFLDSESSFFEEGKSRSSPGPASDSLSRTTTTPSQFLERGREKSEYGRSHDEEPLIAR